jgi:aryl-alcohol dehydrogenase-like predicted oxidoreductase
VYATAAATARYSHFFPDFLKAGFFRTLFDLRVSSLGLGTFPGPPDDATDQAYTAAVLAAINGGINFIDTAINYRGQRSERSIGAALQHVHRDEVVVATKAGFLTPGAVPASLSREDTAGGMHSMAPSFLADQIDRSRANLGIDSIDVLYLDSPETELGFLTPAQFEDRIRRAFAGLEERAERGAIRWYGAATWDGFRMKGALSLTRLAALATEVAGPGHRFRFVEFPFNLAMVEAYVDRPESVLEEAARLGIAVVASASLMQTRVLDGMPESVAALLPGLATPAQRAIQFTRSTPGVVVALVGMANAAHVQENLGVARVAPLTPAEYWRFYQ